MTTLPPNHQFAVREYHATTHQVHRIVNEVAKSLKEKKFCGAVFLDIAQAFDRVASRSTFQTKKYFFWKYYLLLKLYLADRHCSDRDSNSLSDHYPIETGVPQGSCLDHYLIFTADIPETRNTTMEPYYPLAKIQYLCPNIFRPTIAGGQNITKPNLCKLHLRPLRTHVRP